MDNYILYVKTCWYRCKKAQHNKSWTYYTEYTRAKSILICACVHCLHIIMHYFARASACNGKHAQPVLPKMFSTHDVMSKAMDSPCHLIQNNMLLHAQQNRTMHNKTSANYMDICTAPLFNADNKYDTLLIFAWEIRYGIGKMESTSSCFH